MEIIKKENKNGFIETTYVKEAYDKNRKYHFIINSNDLDNIPEEYIYDSQHKDKLDPVTDLTCIPLRIEDSTDKNVFFCNSDLTKVSDKKEFYKEFDVDFNLDIYSERKDKSSLFVKFQNKAYRSTFRSDLELYSEDTVENYFYSIIDKFVESIDTSGHYRFYLSDEDTMNFNFYNIRILEKEKIEDRIINHSMSSLQDNKIYITKYKIKKIAISFNYRVCDSCKKLILHDYVDSESGFCVGEYIYDNENSIKIMKLYKQYKIVRKKFCFRMYKHYNILKKDTLNRYKISNHNISGHPALVNNKEYKKKIVNEKYANIEDFIFSKDIKEAEDIVKSFLKDKLGKEYEYIIKDLKDLRATKGKDISTILNTKIVKEKFKLKSNKLAHLISSLKEMNAIDFSRIKVTGDKELLKYLKINNKYLDYLIENVSMSHYIDIYKYVNPDFLKQIIKKEITTKEKPIYTLNYEIDHFDIPRSRNLLYQYSKNNSNKRFVNQIFKEYETTIDAIRMFDEIKKEVKDYTIDLSANIKNIHDKLSSDYAKLNKENEAINKNEFLENLFKGFSHDGIEYSLAKDTYELIDVGLHMDICVGSYGAMAVKGQCIIAIGYKEGEPVTCLEFTNYNENYKVHQVKKRFNKRPEENEANALCMLFLKNNIKMDTYDLANINLRKQTSLKEA